MLGSRHFNQFTVTQRWHRDSLSRQNVHSTSKQRLFWCVCVVRNKTRSAQNPICVANQWKITKMDDSGRLKKFTLAKCYHYIHISLHFTLETCLHSLNMYVCSLFSLTRSIETPICFQIWRKNGKCPKSTILVALINSPRPNGVTDSYFPSIILFRHVCRV